MNTTNALLDRFADAKNINSDYKLAKELHVSRSAISNMRNGRTRMGPTTAVLIAEGLRMDPMTVIAKLQLERAGDDRVKTVWEKYSGRLLLAALVTTTTALLGYEVILQNENYAHAFLAANNLGITITRN